MKCSGQAKRLVYSKQPHQVYIGDDSQFENPFRVGAHAFNREHAQRKYREYLEQWVKDFPEAQEHFASLHGKVLGCNCNMPTYCHGEVLIEVAEQCYKNIYGDTDEINFDKEETPVLYFDRRGLPAKTR